jgi:hypothetical protein
LADFLDRPHPKFSEPWKDWSVSSLKAMLLGFLIQPAVEQLKPVWPKSVATQSRSGLTVSIDNRVRARLGKLLRCTWSWYSGRSHKVMRGQDFLGVVCTINPMPWPLH